MTNSQSLGKEPAAPAQGNVVFGIQIVGGQIWRKTHSPDCGLISKIVLVLGTTVFLQRCTEDGALLDLMLFKCHRNAMASEDGWELLRF